jgi:predicted transcriptional regulator
MSKKHMIVGTGTLASEAQAFKAAWHRAAAGEPPEEPRYHLGFESVPAMLKALSPKRWALLEALKREGRMSVRALAAHLGRDYKNVHCDVKALIEFGLIEKRQDGVAVPFDIIRWELKLAA